MQAEFVPPTVIEQALADTFRKKALPALGRVRVARFSEGSCAQLMHVGPFSTERPAIERLHAHARARGGLRDHHHEIA